jgi:hypothetical protein
VKDIFDGGMFERTKETPLFGERFWTESSLNDNGIIAIANLLDIDILSDVDINVT